MADHLFVGISGSWQYQPMLELHLCVGKRKSNLENDPTSVNLSAYTAPSIIAEINEASEQISINQSRDSSLRIVMYVPQNLLREAFQIQ